jgi:uncharacterized membrane protein HdeD (DUF308 family)
MEMETGAGPDQPVSKGAMVFAGVLMILLGAVAIILPNLASFFITEFVGWILVIGSLFLFGSAFAVRSAGAVLARLLWAVLALAAGLYLVINPGEGTETLTLILVIYFLATGISQLVFAFSSRGSGGAGWLAVNGLLSLLLGLLIGIEFPSSSDWAIGLLVGINLIFGGWVVVMLGAAAGSAGSET